MGLMRNRACIALGLLFAMVCPSCKFLGNDTEAVGDRKTVSGKISISAELLQTLKPNASIYLTVAPNNAIGGRSRRSHTVKSFGPPLVFPIEFSVSADDCEDCRASSEPFAGYQGKVQVQARLSQSSTSKHESGDISGYSSIVSLGTQGLEIDLKYVRP